MVVVDPIGNAAASKADEWVPIRPGTDAAFGLAFMNVLLVELGVYDGEFLKKGSNAPYLVADDGLYVRDPSSGKPLVFDPVDRAAKTFDDSSIRDYALEGALDIRGVHATPAFELLKKHVAKYPPEWAEAITTVPAPTIRRLAKEFAAAAQIGSTIQIEGVNLPYRPAALDWARGPQGHKHGFHHCWALKLINILVGNVNIPGGIMSTGSRGKHPYEFETKGGDDGMLSEAGWGGLLKLQIPSAYPGRTPDIPESMDIIELFPLAGHATTLFPLVGANPEKYGVGYKIQVGFHTPINMLLSTFGDSKVSEKYFSSIPFMVGYAPELSETNEAFDDIVLPVPSYFERQDAGMPLSFEGNYSVLSPVAQDDYYYQFRPKIVEPPPGVRHQFEVTLAIAERAGFLADCNKVMNYIFRLKDPHKLENGRKYSMEEIQDRVIKSLFGSDKGVGWAKEHGVVRIHRDVEEAYPGPFMTAKNIRLPVYLEHFPRKGELVRGVVQQLGLSWDLSDYIPLPEFQPCNVFDYREKGEFDLVGVHYKLAFIYGHFSNENPWLNEICERTPYTYPVLINEETGKKKGLKDGDGIWLESPVRKVKAIAKLTQCVHPEVIGIAGHFGHWAKGMPISRGKGVAFNLFIPHELNNMDMISTAIDNCIPLKISKAEG